MLTVLIYDERLSSMITEYKPFWDPFLAAEEFALCRWRPQGRTVEDSLPDLYDVVGECGDWRAVVLYHSMAPIGSNPFDFFDGSESAQVVEENDLIRLTHMLSVVPHKVQFMPVGVKAHRFAHVADGEDPLRAEDETKDSLLPPTDKDYILDRELIFQSRNEDKDYYTLGDSNYELLCARPGKILLIATRRRNMSEDHLRAGSGHHTRTVGGCARPLEGFCDRNDYPANIRFLVYDTWFASDTMGERDQFILMHALQTLLMNEAAAPLRAEEVYRLLVRIDEGALEQWLAAYQGRMTMIDSRVRMMRMLLRELHESRIQSGELPDLDSDYYVDLMIESRTAYEISERPYRLCKDAPAKDELSWREDKNESHQALAALLKEPLRRLKYSLDGIRMRVREEEKPVSGRFTREQLEDAAERMEQLERGMFQADATPAARLNEEERDQLEEKVERQIKRRLTRPMALVGLLAAALLFSMGFIPYFIAARKRPLAAAQMAMFVLLGIGILFLIWLLFLMIDRQCLRRRIRSYNQVIDRVVASYRALQQQYQNYVTSAFNYRKYWNFTRQLKEEDDKFYMDEAAKAEVNLLRHSGAARHGLDLCMRVRKAMDLWARELPVLESEEPFTFSQTPEESGYYELEHTQRPESQWADETAVYYGYPFVSGFALRREESHA